MTVESNQLVAMVPREDEALTLAFEELNEKLAAWTAAMNEAVVAIRRQTGASGEASPPTVIEETTAVVEAAKQEAAKPVVVVVEAVPAVNRAVEPIEPPPIAEAIPEALPKRDVLGRMIASPQAAEKIPKLKAPAEQSKDPDEEMLAALDEETAKAIRVMRRVSPTKKSVVQLLEEYQAAQSTAISSGSKKKSWWSRG